MSTKPRVVVLDHGLGNTTSALRAVQRLGAEVELSAQPAAIAAADGLLVPGVGAFGAVMAELRRIGAPRHIERRLAGGRPVLGICVGMQVMFSHGHEHGEHTVGLGQWPGDVTRLRSAIVPHTGWSHVQPPEGSRLFEGVAGERFYFVHSYAVHSDPAQGAGAGPLRPPLVTWAEHPSRFVAAVENGPLTATQFHPEKSGEAGAQLLRNWLTTLR